jgi:Mrp family chromosome partitioning ATPase
MSRLGGFRLLRTVARRWWVVVALAALGAVLAAGSGGSAGDRPRGEPNSATTELVLEPAAGVVDGGADATQRLELASRVARQPEVAEAASAQDPATSSRLFTDRITVTLDRSADAVLITANAPDGESAAQTAAAYSAAAATYIAQTTGIELRPIGAPVAAVGAADQPSADPAGRGALGALAGLALGVLLAGSILPGRDGRLHDRATAERAYSTSVLAQIPRAPGRDRYAGYVAFLTRPTGTIAEAYRVLRCAVLNRERNGVTAPRVIAVTSPSRRDGRTTVARNLAAALAESGRRVLLVDCDFGHPTAHYGISMQPGTGLTDLLQSPEPGARLAEVIQPAETPGVFVLSIGTRGGREPGALANALPHLLAVARRVVDVVILDSEPLDCAGDVVDALAAADAVLIVARAGRTRRAVARHTADLLDRCGTKVAGVVLIGNVRETDARTPYLVGPYEGEVVPELVSWERLPVQPVPA